MKIVINDCFGGFGLSQAAFHRLKELGYKTDEPDIGECWPGKPEPRDRVLNAFCRDIQRHHPLLVKVVEELGDLASAQFARLKIVEIPDDVKWQIVAYDGNEHIAEQHRTWH